MSADEGTQATHLVVPSERTLSSGQNTKGAGPLVWGLVLAAALLIVFALITSRRRRPIDPAERAFRRVVHSTGLTRGQVRALRQEASARGLGSPVGLAMSRLLTDRICAAYERRP